MSFSKTKASASKIKKMSKQEWLHVASFVGIQNFRIVKCCDCSAVLEANDHFYKFHRIDVEDPANVFRLIVWNAFATEYQAMGLCWDFYTVVEGDNLYAVEKREKLEVMQEGQLSRKNVLAKAAKVKDRVQKKLEFPRLSFQIRSEGGFTDTVDKVVLMRDCEFCFSDYAFHNGHVVNLGNSNWKLVLLRNGEWVTNLQAQTIPVRLSFGSFYFTFARIYGTNRPIQKVFNVTAKWWLYSQASGNLLEQEDFFKTELKKMFDTNAKILTTKTDIDVATGSDYKLFDNLQLNSGTSSEVMKLGLKFLGDAGQVDKPE